MSHQYRPEPDTPGYCGVCQLPVFNQRHSVAGVSSATTEAHIDQVITNRALAGGEFSANDIRPQLAYVHTPLIGQRFAALKRSGVLTDTGVMVPSTDPGTHGKRVAVYEAGPELRVAA